MQRESKRPAPNPEWQVSSNSQMPIPRPARGQGGIGSGWVRVSTHLGEKQAKGTPKWRSHMLHTSRLTRYRKTRKVMRSITLYARAVARYTYARVMSRMRPRVGDVMRVARIRDVMRPCPRPPAHTQCASADKLTVFFNRTEWRTKNVLESFFKGYSVENNILTPVVAQKMFHDIVDWTQHNIRPLEYESLTVQYLSLPPTGPVFWVYINLHGSASHYPKELIMVKVDSQVALPQAIRISELEDNQVALQVERDNVWMRIGRSLLGQPVLLFCLNYIYAGKLVGVNDTFVKLEDAKIVYETGAFTNPTYKNAQLLPASACATGKGACPSRNHNPRSNPSMSLPKRVIEKRKVNPANVLRNAMEYLQVECQDDSFFESVDILSACLLMLSYPFQQMLFVNKCPKPLRQKMECQYMKAVFDCKHSL
ncbi:unnamed protein product [Sphagnum jensenii]